MPDIDHSHRSVVDKLGVRPGDRVAWVGVSTRAAGVREPAALIAERAGPAEAGGLVDNQICSLSDCESAMRFAIPIDERMK